MRILLAEDEVSLSKALIKLLQKNNYSADAVFNGQDALEYLQSDNYDVAILDIMMPKIDGITVLKKMRAQGIKTPVLLLTARSESEDKVLGLDSGANYYLTKPFDTKELLAVIRTITRHTESSGTKITICNLTLDRSTYELSTKNGSFRLANKEYQMMEIFMSNPHCLISADRFMERIWGYDSDTEINVVWVYISYLRKKLKALEAQVEIVASRNAGYSLEKKDD